MSTSSTMALITTPTGTPITSAQPDSKLFKMLPPELRRRIYYFCLVNPMLGDPKLALKRKRFAFNLTPNILLTCRQIYQEAIDILYNSNKFIIDFQDLYARTIGRYTSSAHTPVAVLNVKHWVVLLGTETLSKNSDHLGPWCRLMLESPPKSIEVVVYPLQVGRRRAIDNVNRWASFEVEALEKCLLPFGFLRNVPDFSIRSANLEELPDDQKSLARSSVNLMKEFPEVCNKLISLVKSNAPIESIAEMTKAALAYAQSFERYEGYKHQMGWRLDIPDLPRRHPIGCAVCQTRSEWVPNLWYSKDAPYFKLESRFERFPDDKSGNSSFKDLRYSTLKGFETQYLRVTGAANSMAEFVKDNKAAGGIFTLRNTTKLPLDMKDKVASAISKLEAYHAALFIRDMCDIDAVRLANYSERFYRLYAGLPAEKALRELSVELGLEDFKSFLELYKTALADLDQQYLEIRTARKGLFKHDLYPTRCNIDIDFPATLEDGPIDLDVDEPFIGPVFE